MIPDTLTTAPEYPTGRYTAEQRARALASLAPLPVTWTPKRTPEHPTRAVGNTRRALAALVPVELAETQEALRRTTRTLRGQKAHLSWLKQAQTIAEGG